MYNTSSGVLRYELNHCRFLANKLEQINYANGRWGAIIQL